MKSKFEDERNEEELLTRGYQSFNDQIGSSNSEGKLQKLCLPSTYKGMSVLDIGCNEGFFCIDAIKRGATKVTGIDSSEEFIEKARARCDKVNYIHSNWWNLPDEKFDVIYFLSAIHYEKNQKLLLNYICAHLNPNGMLVLECGVINNIENSLYIPVYRPIDGYRRYPTMNCLKKMFLDMFDVKYIGESVPQAGDSVGRYVFHLCPKAKNVILISGNRPMIFNDILQKREFIDFDADEMLYLIKETDYMRRGVENCNEMDFRAKKWIQKLNDIEKKLCIDLMYDMISEKHHIIIYGMCLEDDDFLLLFEEKLKEMGATYECIIRR